MSTDFVTSRKISIEHLFDGRLEKHNIFECPLPESSLNERKLTDGTNWLAIYPDESRTYANLYSWHSSKNDASYIIETIQSEFGVEFFSEHEHGFYIYPVDWDIPVDPRHHRSPPDYDELFADAIPICSWGNGGKELVEVFLPESEIRERAANGCRTCIAVVNYWSNGTPRLS